jgi:hypothetical protein
LWLLALYCELDESVAKAGAGAGFSSRESLKVSWASLGDDGRDAQPSSCKETAATTEETSTDASNATATLEEAEVEVEGQ